MLKSIIGGWNFEFEIQRDLELLYLVGNNEVSPQQTLRAKWTESTSKNCRENKNTLDVNEKKKRDKTTDSHNPVR